VHQFASERPILQFVQPSRPPRPQRRLPCCSPASDRLFTQRRLAQQRPWPRTNPHRGLVLRRRRQHQVACGRSAKMSQGSEVLQQLRLNGARYVALFAVWAIVLGAAANALGLGAIRFWRAFVPIFLVTAVVYFLGFGSRRHISIWSHRWSRSPSARDLQFIRRPSMAGSRTSSRAVHQGGHRVVGREPAAHLTRMGGPVAMLQAAIVSLVTFGVIYALRPGSASIGDSPLPWEPAAQCAACPAPSRSAVWWAQETGYFRGDLARGRLAIVMIFVLPLARERSVLTPAWRARGLAHRSCRRSGSRRRANLRGYAGNVTGISGHRRPPSRIHAHEGDRRTCGSAFGPLCCRSWLPRAGSGPASKAAAAQARSGRDFPNS